MNILKHLYQRIKTRYYKNPVSINLTLLFLIFFLSTTVPSILVINHHNQKASIEERMLSSQAAIDTAASRLQDIINGGRKISTSILSSPSLHNFLQKDFQQRGSADISALENTLYTVCATSTDRLSAYVYDLDNRCYYTDSFQAKKLRASSLDQLPNYDQIREREGGTLVMPTHELYECTPRDDGLSIVRIVNNLETLKPTGTLVINIRNQDLSGCFDSASAPSTSYFILHTESDILLSLQENTVFTQKELLDALRSAGTSGTIQIMKDGIPYLLSLSTLSEHGLTVASLMPMGQTAIHRQGYFSYILAVIFINIVIMLAGMVILSRSLTQPLQRLTSHMRHVGEKNFSTISTPYQVPNEIGLLTDTYNQMTTEIDTLLKQEIEIQKNKRHLELNLLQAQIKPHFIYNTIDTARALCLRGETKQANLLLKAMGSYYQNILSKGKNIITISDELNTIRQYEIIRSYKDDFELNINYEVDDNLLALPILKFILQPLVENSIKHGFHLCDSGTILIKFNLENDVLTIDLTDDGLGIPQKQITDILNQTVPDTRSFGLRATIERMRIYYGDRYDVAIHSRVNEGTSIQFTIHNYSSFIPEGYSEYGGKYDKDIEAIDCR